jgi:hypothetical protein
VDDEGTRGRNRLGAVAFVIAVIGALFAIFPGTAPFGGLLCLAAIVPAIIAMRRVRKGTADTRRRSVAALVGAPRSRAPLPADPGGCRRPSLPQARR